MRYFEMASISIRCIDWLLVFCNMHTLLTNIDHNSGMIARKSIDDLENDLRNIILLKQVISIELKRITKVNGDKKAKY